MNKYIIGLLVFGTITAQAGFAQMPRVAQGRGMQRGRVVGTVPMQQQQRMQAGKTVLQGFAARTREDEAKAVELTKNNQQQFLNKLGMFLNRLAADGKVIVNCVSPASPSDAKFADAKFAAQYVNPIYVGRSGETKMMLGGQSAKCTVWAKGGNLSSVANEIHQFVKDNAGSYKQQCQLVGNVAPKNMLLKYVNPTNANAFCYVYSDLDMDTQYTYMGAPTVMQEPTKGTNFVGPMKK